MANTKMGIKLEAENEKQFKSALAQINQEFKTLSAQAEATASAYDSNDKSVKALTTRNEGLEQSIEKQREKLELMNKALENASESYGENDKRTLKWKEQIAKTETAINKMTKEVDENNKSIDKQKGVINGAKDKYNELKEKAEELKEKHHVLAKSMEVVSKSAKGLASGGLKLIGTAAKSSLAALGALGTAAIKLGKDVVESYGELEQNLGGSEAVFGAYAEKIQRIGEDAYKNMGVTQSEYLANANKMGALFQGSGLSQKESLEMTEKAMQRAADMASVMGIETSAALEAVTGAAKGNYTMMDNLGVKMDATTLEAYAAAEGFTKAYKDMSNTEKTELAMQYFFENTSQYAGNFARESSETISGSIGMLKSSAESLIAGLGNTDADIQNIAGNVIESFGLVAQNISPVIENISESLPALASTAVEALDGDLLPVVMDCMTSLIASMSQTAPKIVVALADGLVDNLDKLLDSALVIVTKLTQGLLTEENIKKIMSAAVSLLTKLTVFLADNVELIIDSAFLLIDGLVDGLLEEDNMKKLVEASIDVVGKIATSLIDNIPTLLESAGDLCKALFDAIRDYDWWALAKSVFESLKSGIRNLWNMATGGGGGGDPQGSYAGGLPYVPYDGFVAELHKGERVLTAEESRTYSDGKGKSVNVTLHIENFNNNNAQDINRLADELSVVLASKMQRKERAYA